MRTTSYSDLRRNLAAMLASVLDDHTPVIITRDRGNPAAVLISLGISPPRRRRCISCAVRAMPTARSKRWKRWRAAAGPSARSTRAGRSLRAGR
ncbi:type II toxin-antitoxin system Phd/YefM family antitoxin [Constrictibacter sp. MBR-5]|uniref:type II toxin-antitoxin system Phd/YefM family antitoxin n=1 Tax=Constrictibacter sp. MBR-5 TaxID=3156467 RepID=UPI0033921F26